MDKIDPLFDEFIALCLDRRANAMTSLAALREAYVQWYNPQIHKNYSPKSIGRSLAQRGFEVDLKAGIVAGITVKETMMTTIEQTRH